MEPHLCILLMDELSGNKYITLTRSPHPNRNILQLTSKGTKKEKRLCLSELCILLPFCAETPQL